MNSFRQKTAITLIFLIATTSCMSLKQTNYSTSGKNVDPVCGQVVADSTISTKLGHTVYYFDSEECRSVFLKDPERFTTQKNRAQNHMTHWGILGGSVMVVSMAVIMLFTIGR
ncbi:MAG: YHS domain-containing protein [Cyclobacteriaceae bacterium]